MKKFDKIYTLTNSSINFFWYLFFYFFLLTLSILANSSSTKLDTVGLQLSYFHQFQFAGFYAAQAKGFYKDLGLYVKIYEKKENTNVTLDVVLQKSNFGIAKEFIIQQNLAGIKISLLKAIYQHTPYAIITLKKNNIRTPTDLVGKKLMLANSILSPQLYSLFKNEGIEVQNLLLVKHSYNYNDLISGKVDAVTGHTTVQPFYIKEKGYEPYIINPADYGVDFYGAMLFTSQKEIKEHKERADRFIKASMKGWKYAYNNIEETVDIILSLPTKNKNKPTKEILLYEAKVSKKYVLPDIVELGHINPTRIEKMANIFKEMGLVNKNAVLDKDFIYNPKNNSDSFNIKRFYLIISIAVFLIFIFLFIILILRSIIKNKTKSLELEIYERTQQEKKLVVSEEKYRALFNSVNAAILIMDEDKFIGCNPKTLEIFNCTKEQIINETPSKFSPKYQPDNSLSEEKAHEKIILCLAGKPQTFEWKHLKFDGSEFDAEVKLTKLVFANKTQILAIVHDITELKTKAKRLKESEEKFSKIFQNNPIPILLTSLENSTIIDCNKSFLKFSEYTFEEVIGKTPNQLHLWLNQNDKNQFIAELYKNHFISEAYYKFQTKSKKIIHCLVSAEIATINGKKTTIGTYQIINELLEKDSILKEVRLKFSKIFELSPTSMIITSYEEGRILDINQHGLSTLVKQKKDIIGKTTIELNIWKNKNDREFFLELLEKQGYVKNFESTIYVQNKQIPCSISAEIIELNNKKYIIGSLWDLSAIKNKELELQDALNTVEKLKTKLQKENIVLKQEINTTYNIGNIITNSEQVKIELQKIQQVANTNSTVLITGETGTGKELFARAIHSLSNRASFPLITINCASLPPSLIESELFGHEKGAFTGAIKQKIGKFELANNATLFLDEVGELPLEIQSKLLRVLQEGEFERIGSNQLIKTNARVIAATNRNLKKMVENGNFREDLFYRLNVFPIKTIPLRERPEDIKALINHFVKTLSIKLGKKIDSIKKSSLDELLSYSFPGNIRELENIIERAIIISSTSILECNIPSEEKKILGTHKMIFEKEKILSALKKSNWKIEGNLGASKILNIPPSTLRDKIKKYNLKRPSI